MLGVLNLMNVGHVLNSSQGHDIYGDIVQYISRRLSVDMNGFTLELNFVDMESKGT